VIKNNLKSIKKKNKNKQFENIDYVL